MSQITTDDLLMFVRIVEQQKGKYIKATLTALEKSGVIDKEQRKVILDNFNNFARSICRVCGYVVEE